MSNRLELTCTDFEGILYRTSIVKLKNGDTLFCTNDKSYKLCHKWLLSINYDTFMSLYTDASCTTRFLHEVSYLHVRRIEDFVNAPYEEYCDEVL